MFFGLLLLAAFASFFSRACALWLIGRLKPLFFVNPKITLNSPRLQRIESTFRFFMQSRCYFLIRSIFLTTLIPPATKLRPPRFIPKLYFVSIRFLASRLTGLLLVRAFLLASFAFRPFKPFKTSKIGFTRRGYFDYKAICKTRPPLLRESKSRFCFIDLGAFKTLVLRTPPFLRKRCDKNPLLERLVFFIFNQKIESTFCTCRIQNAIASYSLYEKQSFLSLVSKIDSVFLKPFSKLNEFSMATYFPLRCYKSPLTPPLLAIHEKLDFYFWIFNPCYQSYQRRAPLVKIAHAKSTLRFLKPSRISRQNPQIFRFYNFKIEA